MVEAEKEKQQTNSRDLGYAFVENLGLGSDPRLHGKWDFAIAQADPGQ